MENTCFYLPYKNTDLQPLNHIISTAHYATKKALEFLYPMPTALVTLVTVIYLLLIMS